MKFNRVTALLLSLTLAFSLAACGQGASSASSASSSSAASSAAAETKTEEQLLAEENEILSANDALWEKVFASMDKNITETTLSTNYGDFLRSSVEKTKDQFSDEEYKTLTADAEKIRAIEEQIATLALADAAASGAAAQGTAFPQFEGSDLEGNPVDNSLFAGNAFTVVNFWFNGCKPCVEELDDLNALNEKVKAQGGEVVGINTETLDGNQQGIDAAKKLLAATGASYRNIYFASGSDAGKFALNIMAFPTTYVFDRDGNVVGQPLLGGIDKEENLAALQKNIDAARSTGAWGYVEPLSQTPTWVHFDRRYGTPACRGTTAGYPTLRRGSRGCYVMILQDALSTLGYQTGNRIDGIFGSRTEEALKGYQRRTSLRADGVCGCNSWKKISTAVLGVGRTKTTID